MDSKGDLTERGRVCELKRKSAGRDEEISAKKIGKSSKLPGLLNLVPRKKEKFIGNIKENYREEDGDKRLKTAVFVDFSCADEYMI